VEVEEVEEDQEAGDVTSQSGPPFRHIRACVRGGGEVGHYSSWADAQFGEEALRISENVVCK